MEIITFAEPRLRTPTRFAALTLICSLMAVASVVVWDAYRVQDSVEAAGAMLHGPTEDADSARALKRQAIAAMHAEFLLCRDTLEALVIDEDPVVAQAATSALHYWRNALSVEGLR